MMIQDSQPFVEAIVADGLTDDECEVLLRCINGVRSGETEYFVELTNRKQTNSRKRMPGDDYQADPALVPGGHRGWLVAAPRNKAELIYLHVYDEARAASKGDKYGHTRATLQGLRSFKVMEDPRTGDPITRPGPLAPDVEDVVEAEAPQAQAPVAAAFDPQKASQALMLQSQAMMCQAQALMLQAYSQPNPPSL